MVLGLIAKAFGIEGAHQYDDNTAAAAGPATKKVVAVVLKKLMFSLMKQGRK